MGDYKPVTVDNVMGILGLYHPEEDESWPISKVYDVFYEMWSDKDECPREIYFSIRGGYHYSKKLEETFFQLGTSRLLEVRNPEYSSVLLSKESKTRIKNYLKGVLSPEDFDKISTLSEQFREQMKKVLAQKDVDVCTK